MSFREKKPVSEPISICEQIGGESEVNCGKKDLNFCSSDAGLLVTQTYQLVIHGMQFA